MEGMYSVFQTRSLFLSHGIIVTASKYIRTSDVWWWYYGCGSM